MKPNKSLKSRSLTALLVATLISSQASSQIHIVSTEQPQWSILAEDQFQQEFYRAAIQSANEYLEHPFSNTPIPELTDIERARYQKAVAQLRIATADGEEEAIAFYNSSSNNVYKQRVALAIARHYFVNNQLAAAIPWYEKADIANLSNQEIADKKFELAYCYFNIKQFDKAEPLFATIKEIKGKYYTPGNYYYGLLAYNKGEYAAALKSFERITSLPDYKAVVPYYIAEIYYFMGNRDMALSESLRLIGQKEKLYYDNELHLLAAQCYFEQKNFKEALPYFEYYYDHSDHIRRDELYELAYCYYQLKDINKSIENFSQLNNTQDSLGQSAMYLLGDCYIKKGDKKSARNAFATCADMNFNQKQRESSLLISGKLAYEMGYYDEATRRINTLLKDYPQSAYKEEAKTISSDLLNRTNNYAAAYNNMKGLQLKDEQAKKIFQKATYGYAMQQLQKGELKDANVLLAQSIQQPADDNYTAAAYFWRSDIAYQQQAYDFVIKYGKEYLSAQKDATGTEYISPMATEQHVYMNMGYAAMKLEEFDAAKQYFAKAQHAKGNGTATLANAVLREADAAFMQKDFKEALKLYDKSINTAENTDADYAKFQKSIILGLQNKTAEKVAILRELESKMPKSAYADEARYELASTYLEQAKYKESIALLETIATNAEARRAPSATLKLGFAHLELEEKDEAKKYFQQVVTRYPGTEEKTAAMDALKNLYIQNNEPAAYAQFLRDNNLSDVTNGNLDSTYYAAAEAQYAAGKYEQAKAAMDQYLTQFKDGIFTNRAHFYKAESDYQLKDYNDALIHYKAVLDAPWNLFSESSAKKAAVIAYQNEDYATANQYYALLGQNALNEGNKYVSYIGLMKTNFFLKNYEPSISYADTLLRTTSLNETTLTEASFYKAKALLETGQNEAAKPIFEELKKAKNNTIATEARYRVAEVLLKENKLKEAETAANETIQNAGGNDYWIVKSYILLADLLTQQKDYFNAKATLQSVVKNTKIEELKAIANQKLEEVNSLEKTKSKLQD